MQIKTFPHEFMARWGRDGKLQGYHVITVDIACDEAGVPIKKSPADPTSENLIEKFGEATTLERVGLTLDEILGEVHAAALSEVDVVRAALADAKTTIASLETAHTADQAEVQRLAGELAAAKARVSELGG